MRLSGLIIGVLLIGLFITGFYGVVNDLAADDYYSVEVNSTYESAFDKTFNISTQINSDYEDIVGDGDNNTGFVVDKLSYLALIPNVVSLAVNMVKLPFAAVEEMYSSVLEFFYIPSEWEGIIIAIIIAMIVFALFALILRYRYT